MLSKIDNIIFPDRCDVVEILPSQRYVYPIFKNGSSSLKHNQRILTADELTQVKVIDVYVRDPYERFISGVQTFLQHHAGQYDRKTALLLISEYLFFNRHFCPQFHWLVNLHRHTTAKIRINHISSLSEITNLHENRQIKDADIDEFFKSNDKLHFYLSIDKVLTEVLIGHTVKFVDIVFNSVFSKLPNYIDFCTERTYNESLVFLDLGSDNDHPGPKQHEHYAEKIYQLIKENYHGKTI